MLGDEPVAVAPFLMPGGTDSRHYIKMSRNGVLRFVPTGADPSIPLHGSGPWGCWLLTCTGHMQNMHSVSCSESRHQAEAGLHDTYHTRREHA